MRPRRYRCPFTALAVLLPAAAACPREDARTVDVAAAANLSLVMKDLAARFEQQTGTRVALNLASTGKLTHQIENGAPVDLFLAADLEHVAVLQHKGLIEPDSVAVYARGQLVIWSATHSVSHLADLARPEIRRIAIANPSHAPYGVAARQALQAAGVWEQVQAKLVLGENVAQALQFAERDAEIGLIALPLARQASGKFTPVPPELHKPLSQALAIVRGCAHADAARALRAFILGEAGRAVLRAHGFDPPAIATP